MKDKIKNIIEDVVEKVKKDPDFAKKFKKDPVKAIEGVIGIDLDEDKIDEVVKAIKVKLKLDDSKLVDKIKDLF